MHREIIKICLPTKSFKSVYTVQSIFNTIKVMLDYFTKRLQLVTCVLLISKEFEIDDGIVFSIEFQIPLLSGTFVSFLDFLFFFSFSSCLSKLHFLNLQMKSNKKYSRDAKVFRGIHTIIRIAAINAEDVTARSFCIFNFEINRFVTQRENEKMLYPKFVSKIKLLTLNLKKICR